MSFLTEEEERARKREERNRVSRQQIIEHVKKNLLYTPFDVKWVPYSATFAVVGQYPNNQGSISLFQLNKGELRVEQEIKTKMPMKCCTFGHNNVQQQSSITMCVGDFAGGLSVWDIEHLDGEPVFHNGHAHESIINAVDGAQFTGPPEIASCGRDGCVKVWDVRQAAKPVVSLNPTDPAHARDCWTVRFGNSFDPDERVVAAGYDNGDVKLFDLRMQKMSHEFNVGNGVCDLEFDRPDISVNKLIVSSLEGRIRVYDMRTLHPKLGYAYVEERVSSGTVWCTRALPQNREIFLCGGGGELTLCCYHYPAERVLRDADGTAKGVPGAVAELNRAKVGDQPIHALDWSRGKEGLLVCASFDQSIRVMLVTKLSLVQ
ncbi:WD40 repeat [Trypanosoma melophagium]|uniref:WD40 repeat n=1 Tax=Trypanosoma melophagium TaxID=715481 RepID=UPI00351A98F5|nr:WD40 repeat [Trypanosoma melophagium]